MDSTSDDLFCVLFLKSEIQCQCGITTIMRCLDLLHVILCLKRCHATWSLKWNFLLHNFYDTFCSHVTLALRSIFVFPNWNEHTHNACVPHMENVTVRAQQMSKHTDRWDTVQFYISCIGIWNYMHQNECPNQGRLYLEPNGTPRPRETLRRRCSKL